MKKRSLRSEPVLPPDLAAVLACGLRPLEAPGQERNALRKRVLDRLQNGPPEGTHTVRDADVPWHSVSSLIQVKLLRRDRASNSQTLLIRMLPGARILPHVHEQEEECLVLEGEVQVGRHRLFQGDLHVAAAGARHEPIVSPEGALLMIRGEIPPGDFRLA